MNKDLDILLCLLDGKITVYRQNNPHLSNVSITEIQKEIQKLWSINKEE